MGGGCSYLRKHSFEFVEAGSMEFLAEGNLCNRESICGGEHGQKNVDAIIVGRVGRLGFYCFLYKSLIKGEVATDRLADWLSGKP